MNTMIIILVIAISAIVCPTMMIQQSFAFPCQGKIRSEYCQGYRQGADRADADDAAGRGVDVTQSPCPGGNTPTYCS